MLIPTPSDVKRARARRYLADYVEETTWDPLRPGHRLKLHRWQRDALCPRLDDIGKGLGLRLIIHAPPQFGKSIVLTKRMPAQKLGQNPLLRIAIAAYNIEHATRLSNSTRIAMLSSEHRSVFKNSDGWVPERSSMGEYSTYARLGLNDAQPSVAAYGLNAGFTGNGADVLLIDDPYSTPDEAFSSKINDSVWRWWDELASVRVNDETDVVAMFHRYHKNDLAGRLLGSELGFEYLRFPAVADDAGNDPTRQWRGAGELLSPIRSQAFVDSKRRANPAMFAGQFQGEPRDKEGALFKREMFEIVDERPHLDLWMRAIDPASSVKQTNDNTATALVGIDGDNSIVIADVTAWRRTWPETRDGRWEGGRPYEKDMWGQPLSRCVEDGVVQLMKKDLDYVEAEADAHAFAHRATYLVGFAKKGMGLPMVQDLAQNELVAHVPLYPVEEGTADKLQKASAWASRAYIRPIRLVRAPWNEAFIGLCLDFRGDGTTPDDEVDAVSIAMILLRLFRGNELERERTPQPGSIEYHERLVALNPQ